MTSTAAPPAPDSPSSLPRMTQSSAPPLPLRAPLVPGRGDTSVGSWPARWPPDSSLLSSWSPPRSSRRRRATSPARSCADSRWAGRCWPCSRCGSPISHNDGPRRRPCLMAVMGVASLSGSAAVHEALGWVWPPALLGLVVWMFLRIRRRLRSRGARWLLYPVLAVLAIAAVGGGFETVREVARRQGLSDARPAGRRRRTPAASALHRLRQPHRRPGTGSRRMLV